MGNRYIVLFLCPFVELQKVKSLLKCDAGI